MSLTSNQGGHGSIHFETVQLEPYVLQQGVVRNDFGPFTAYQGLLKALRGIQMEQDASEELGIHSIDTGLEISKRRAFSESDLRSATRGSIVVRYFSQQACFRCVFHSHNPHDGLRFSH